MRYLALACSYDQPVASDGRIDPATVAGLRRLVASGRHLILVSRRRVEDLLEVLPEKLFAPSATSGSWSGANVGSRSPTRQPRWRTAVTW